MSRYRYTATTDSPLVLNISCTCDLFWDTICLKIFCIGFSNLVCLLIWIHSLVAWICKMYGCFDEDSFGHLLLKFWCYFIHKSFELPLSLLCIINQCLFCINLQKFETPHSRSFRARNQPTCVPFYQILTRFHQNSSLA